MVAALLALAVVAGAKAAGPALKATFATLSEAIGFGGEGSTRPRKRR
jgi:Flp pilus assembly pilin Flp